MLLASAIMLFRRNFFDFLVLCVSFTWSCEIDVDDSSDAFKPKNSASFCSRDLSVRDVSSDCSYQLQPWHNDSCNVRVTKDPSTCNQRGFQGEVCTENNACGIYLTVSRNPFFSQPAIVNVSIPNSGINSVQFKYSLYQEAQTTSNNKNYCINLTLHKPASLDYPAFFDCEMEIVKENYVSLFSYLVDNKYGQFLMKIPNGKNITKAIPFYVHVITNEDQSLSPRQRRMTVTFQAYPPSAVNGAAPVYKIEMYKSEEINCKSCSNCNGTLVGDRIVNTSDRTTYIDNWRDLYTAEINTSLSDGTYKIVVEPACQSGSTTVPNENCLIIYNIKVKTTTPTEVFGIIAGIVLLILLITAVAHIIHVRRVFLHRKYEFVEPKTVYLIYKDISKSHTDYVMALAEFLSEHLNLKVWIDRKDIVRTGDRNPSVWSARCIEDADHVIVVTPPSVSPDHEYHTVYSYNFEMGCKHLELRIKRLVSVADSAADKLCTVVFLPDSSLSKLSKALWPYRRFYFPTDATNLEYYVWRDELKPNILYPCLTLGLFTWLTGNRNRFYKDKFNEIVTKFQNEPKTEVETETETPFKERVESEASGSDPENAIDDGDIVYYETVVENENLNEESEHSDTGLVFF